jgi:hypothetical protein
MKSHAIQNTQTLIGAFFGVVFGVALVFIPFALDAIRNPSPAFAVVGCVYFFAVFALSVSAVVRFLGFAFSVRIRDLVAKHPVAHAILFAVGFGVILGILIVALFGSIGARGHVSRLTMSPNKSPEPTAVGAVSSAVPPSFHFGATGAVHAASRRWLSFLERNRICQKL